MYFLEEIVPEHNVKCKSTMAYVVTSDGVTTIPLIFLDPAISKILHLPVTLPTKQSE